MGSMRYFVDANRIKVVSCKWVDENPHMPEFNGNNYQVTLQSRCRADNCSKVRRMTVYFSMGYGHSSEPTAEDILDCLASDSSSVEDSSFEEWARDLGYDVDSRKAEKVYNTCERQAKKLKQFLGETEYARLLYQTERL